MRIKTIFSVILLCAASIQTASAQEQLTGDVRLACEAILCLSSSVKPGECSPSLSRYFGISHKKWKDTLNARKSFLNLCPTAGADSKMQSLVDAIANGAGRCDVANLNSLTSSCSTRQGDDQTCISNKMPGYCSVYLNHEYTNLNESLPVYVGTPSEGGFWTEKANYETALKQYNERKASNSRYWMD